MYSGFEQYYYVLINVESTTKENFELVIFVTIRLIRYIIHIYNIIEVN